MTESQAQLALQRPLEPLGDDERLRAAGAMLFVSTEPVPITAIAHQLGCSRSEAEQTLRALSIALQPIGLMTQWTGDDLVQLGTAPDLAGILRQFLGQERIVRLSQAALETVALIAYRQPVTRADLEAVRGVDSTGVLQTLLARSVIEPAGRLPTVGNPVLYATTPEFLRLFGLASLDDLPQLPEELVEALDERATVIPPASPPSHEGG
jgi:segregation and condensation protein B